MQTKPHGRTRRPRLLAAGVVAAVATALPVALAGPAGAVAAGPALASPALVNRAPAAVQHRTARVIDLPAGLRPEGVEAGPGGLLFVGSLADGRIQVVDTRTGRSRVLLPGAEGRALRGLRYDARSGLLWAVGNDGPTAVVRAVSVRTGTVVRRVEVPGGGFLNDLDLTRDAVWVTDSAVDRLTRIPLASGGRPSSAAPSFVPLRGDWPTPAGNRANGIRVLDRHTVLVVNSAAAVLRTVDVRTGVARAVRTTGATLTGGDGLVLRGRTLYVVRGTGQDVVTQLRLSTSRQHGRTTWTARFVRDLTDPALDVPSTATLAGGRLWAVNARFGVADPATAGYQVVGLSLHH